VLGIPPNIELPQRALEAVGHRRFDGRVVRLDRWIGGEPAAHIGARLAACDRYPNGGPVHASRFALLARERQVAVTNLPDDLAAPAAETEQPVGLVDGAVALDVGDHAAMRPFAPRDELGIERLAQQCHDVGRQTSRQLRVRRGRDGGQAA